MRRKSTRNANKSPEKALKEIETPPPVKARRSRRRKHTPSSKSSDTEDDEIIRKHSNKRSSSATTTTTTTPETTTTTTVEETPDTTTKSHTPSDDENNDGTSSQEPVWKVTTSSDEQHHGEIQKLKICLTRPSPDSPEKTKPQRSRSKSNSQTEDDTTTSSEDKSTTPTTRRSTRTTTTRGSPFVDEGDEQKKGKGKSKGKHKTKIEQSPKLNETNNDNQTMNIEISENVQVTQQSPTIDKRVDIEKDDDDNKVVDDVDNGECSKINHNDSGTVDNKEKSDDIIESEQKSIDKTDDKNDQKVNNDDDDDDKPLSRIVEQNIEEKSSETEKSTIEQEKPEIIEKDDKNESTEEQKAEEKEITEENNKIHEESNKIHEETSEDSNKIHEETCEESSKIHEETCEESSKIHEETSEEGSKIHEETENNQSEDRVEEPKSNEAEKDKIEQSENKSGTEIVDESKEEVRQSETTSMETEDSTATLNTTRIKKDARKSQHRRLIRDRELDKTIETIEKTKSKWNINLEKSSNLIKIDLEAIQIVSSTTIEFPEEPDLNIDTTVPQSIQERRRSSQTIDKKIERKISIEQQKLDDKIDENIEQATNLNNDGDNSKSNIIAYNRKISIVDDTASKLKPPPSPAKNPIAQVLFITNLVRPFTIKQLRELLERTGKIVEDGFWTDRIKSKCYVQYETVEEAEATRNALHGVQWPIGNGKKLIIDYATIEDLENAKNPPPPVTPTATVPEVVATKENLEPSDGPAMVDDRKIKDMEKRRPDGPIREWDIGKKDVRRERSRSRDRDNRKHRRSPTPIDDFITKKQKKSEEVVPQKLMDDLFLKTKATPSIYWQPLSPEEIATKQQQRLIRMEEHKRRIEESSRFRPRDGRGGNFRRRYD